MTKPTNLSMESVGYGDPQECTSRTANIGAVVWNGMGKDCKHEARIDKHNGSLVICADCGVALINE